MFELKNSEKDRKMATLIDKFCFFFDQNSIFIYCNCHEETKCNFYISDKIGKEY
ncbi:MAG: hypothetical protein ACR5KW_01880 [Wolbachia sp.]